MINSVSFVVMAPLNLGLTVYPKALRNSPFIFCIIRLRWAFNSDLSDAESATNLPFNSPLTTTAITRRSGRLRQA
jgi:hypothetical protein